MKRLTLDEVVKLIQTADIVTIEHGSHLGYLGYCGWDGNRYTLGVDDRDDILLRGTMVFDVVDNNSIYIPDEDISIRLYQTMEIK